MSSVAAEPKSRTGPMTLLLGGLGALAEGYDLQSAGVAAPRIGPEFMLNAGEMGWVFTSNTIGLFLGAAIGGWIADRIGRKWVLAWSMVLFGVFTVGSALAPNYEIMVLMRFLTGLGLGGALPNLIAIVAETGTPKDRATKVTMLTAAIPFGGMFANILVLAVGPTIDWRLIFHVGGWPPIVIGIAMLFLMPESQAFIRQKAERARQIAANEPPKKQDVVSALFSQGRTRTTILLWSGFFFTLLVLYLLLNWLPTLLVAKGFDRPQSIIINMLFSGGGGTGAIVLAWCLAKLNRRAVIATTYVAMGLGLFALAAIGKDLAAASAAAFVVGFFVIGAQFLLYGLSSTLYPGHVRATGVGWAVAVGRLGSVAGPALAAVILSAGRSGSDVIMSILPCVAIALAAVLVLLWTAPEAHD